MNILGSGASGRTTGEAGGDCDERSESRKGSEWKILRRL